MQIAPFLNKITNLIEPKEINFGKRDTEMKKSCLISYSQTHKHPNTMAN